MQVRARAEPGGSRQSDDFSRANQLSGTYTNVGQMAIDGGELSPVTDHDTVAVPQLVSAPNNDATGSCHDWRAGCCFQVNAVMFELLADDGMLAQAKR